MTDTATSRLHGDPFCEAARAIDQHMRHETSAIITGVLGSLPVIGAYVFTSVAVGAPTGPAAPVVGHLAGAAAAAATTAGIYYVHEGIHDWIDSRQNRTPAVAPGDLSCKQYLSFMAMSNLRAMQHRDDSGMARYEGSGLQKILRASPRVLDEILATPLHSDPMNVSASDEEKRLRGFAVDNAPRPMTKSEQRWGEYSTPAPRQ